MKFRIGMVGGKTLCSPLFRPQYYVFCKRERCISKRDMKTIKHHIGDQHISCNRKSLKLMNFRRKFSQLYFFFALAQLQIELLPFLVVAHCWLVRHWFCAMVSSISIIWAPTSRWKKKTNIFGGGCHWLFDDGFSADAAAACCCWWDSCCATNFLFARSFAFLLVFITHLIHQRCFFASDSFEQIWWLKNELHKREARKIANLSAKKTNAKRIRAQFLINLPTSSPTSPLISTSQITSPP